MEGHGGGKKLDDLRELKGEVSLREVPGMRGLPPDASGRGEIGCGGWEGTVEGFQG